MNEFEALYELSVPHSAEAEQSVIGSMLIDPSCITDVLGRTSIEDFYLPINRNVFNVISEMNHTGKKIDPVTVLDQMKKDGTYTDESQGYVLELMQVTPTAANVMKYVEILNNETMKRGLLNLTTEAANKVRNNEKPQNICSYIQGETEKLAESQTRSDLISSLDACTEFYNMLDEMSGSKRKPYVRSGYEQLDAILGGGFVNEGLYIIAARPGCGKTTLGLQIADRAAKSGIPTIFMSLEMSRFQITAKRVAVITGMSSNKITTGEVYDEEFKKIENACSELSDYPLAINRKPSATVDEIGFLARQVKGLGLVVVDYLGLIRNSAGKSLYEKATDTSNNLKRLARTLGVPIICLAQLNREVEGRGGKPRISDLRDSGAIEQDADGILLLHRNMEDIPENDYTPTELICTVGKNRHGKTGEMRFQFFLSSGRIFATRE